tara:strand:+ start:114 stop:488 length:375 start_codon:yes stop_codon:yes gene_type:complete
MRIFRKYEFGSKSAATTKINALGVDEEGAPTHGHAVAALGNIMTTKGTYDDDGNEITAPVYSDKYHVDVLWSGEPVADWDNQMVWCRPFGVHHFGSSSANAEYIAKCKELHPEYFPEPSDDYYP